MPDAASSLGGLEAVSGCGDALHDDFGWGLGMLFRAYVAAAHDAVAEIPGGPRGYQVLSATVRSQVRSQLALAQLLGIDRTVMTYLIDDLEAAGLIERQPDPADRRARRLLPTPKGVQVLSELDSRLHAAEDHLLEPLPGDAREVFRGHLKQLAARLNALDPVRDACAAAAQVDVDLPAPKALRPR